MIIDREKLSPMMRRYFEIKENYKDCLLFFRLGDFYEMFFDDAVTASRVLDLTLKGVGNHFNREKLRAGRKGAYVRSSVPCS